MLAHITHMLRFSTETSAEQALTPHHGSQAVAVTARVDGGEREIVPWAGLDRPT